MKIKWLNIVLLLTITGTFIYCTSFRQNNMDWDVFGYYLYLPAWVIHDDIDLERKTEWVDPLIEKYQLTSDFYQAYKAPNGKYVFKYTMGLAFLYSPFFVSADLFVRYYGGYDRDGFTLPYQRAMQVFIYVMLLLGLFFIYKTLLIYYSKPVSLLTLLAIAYGTNYYVLSFWSGLMPHLSLFTIFAVILNLSIKWYEKQKIHYAIIIGACAGLAMLIRPTSVVALMIPLLWGVNNKITIRNRVILLRSHMNQLLLLVFTAFLVVLPQLIYWHQQTGIWLFYSYPGEKLDLLSPEFFNVFFSYKKGWLLYSPLMAFAIIGFIPFFKYYRPYFFSVFIFFIVNTWVVSSWDCWWYGGSFGLRAFVESYAFMVFPLAAFIDWIRERNIALKVIALSILAFLIYLNIFQTYQALYGIIHTERMSGEYYRRIFLKKYATPYDKLWLNPEPYFSEEDRIDWDRSPVVADSITLTGPHFENNNAEFSQPVKVRSDLYEDYYKRIYIEFSANLRPFPDTQDGNIYLVVDIFVKGKSFQYRNKPFTRNQVMQYDGHISTEVSVPPHVSEYPSEIKCYLYNPGRNHYEIKELEVRVISTGI